MVEILTAVAKLRPGHLPDPDVVEGWKKAYLAVWDGSRSEPWPERRAVLVRTFNAGQAAGA